MDQHSNRDHLGRLGGWYEHVTPPPLPAAAPAATSSYAYGFRVPLLVVSAYTPTGTVSNVQGLDFGTILKFIEGVFNLETIPNKDGLSFGDSWSNGDLSEFFQFSNARSFQAITAPLSANVFLNPDRPIGPPDNE